MQIMREIIHRMTENLSKLSLCARVQTMSCIFGINSVLSNDLSTADFNNDSS